MQVEDNFEKFEAPKVILSLFITDKEFYFILWSTKHFAPDRNTREKHHCKKVLSYS